MRNRTTTLFAGALIASVLASCLSAQHDCSQAHPGKAKRLAQSIKDGDVAVCKGIAGHTVRYAIERFDIADLTTPEDMTRAANQMYAFMKWRLGSPSLVTAQYLTRGFEHFDNGYSDEAAAMLLRVFEFKAQKPELQVPVWMQNWIEGQIGQASEAIAALLSSHGVPSMIAGPLADKIEQALKNVAKRNSVGMFVPKSFDVENSLVDAAIVARRAAAQGDSPLSQIPGRRPLPNHRPLRNPGAPRAESPNGTTTGPASSDRIAALEQRMAVLETTLTRIVDALDELGEPTGADTAPAAAGYRSLHLYGRTWGRGRLHVEVNGAQIAIFDQDQRFDLTPFLVPGRRNRLGIRFEPAADAILGDLTVSISGTLPGQEEPVEFFKFACAKDRLSDSVEVPVAPAPATRQAAGK